MERMDMNIIDRIVISMMFMALLIRPITDNQMHAYGFGVIVVFSIWNVMIIIIYWKKERENIKNKKTTGEIK